MDQHLGMGETYDSASLASSDPFAPPALISSDVLDGDLTMEKDTIHIPALRDSASRLIGIPCVAVHHFRIRAGSQHKLFLLVFLDRRCLLARVQITREADKRPAPTKETIAQWQADDKLFREHMDDIPSVNRIQRMISEVATIRYLKRYTQVPVPEVFGYDLDEEGKIGGSYILQSILSGVTLDDMWPAMTFEQKLTFVESLAELYKQLWQIRLSAIGSLYEDFIDPCRFRVGPFVMPIYNSDDVGPFATCPEHLIAIASGKMDILCPQTEAQRETRRKLQLEVTDRLAIAVQSISSHPCSNHCTLVHPDWDCVNILVDAADPGRITGVLDWTWARVVPAWELLPCLPQGCEQNVTSRQYYALRDVLVEIVVDSVPECGAALEDGQSYRRMKDIARMSKWQDEEETSTNPSLDQYWRRRVIVDSS